MEDLHMNNTSQEESFDYNIYDYDYSNYTDYFSEWSNLLGHMEHMESSMYVFTCIIIGIGLPLTLIAIYALYCQVRNGQVVSIYVINLLVSDIIQLCCLIFTVTTSVDLRRRRSIPLFIYNLSLAASVGFMVCVALERYLVVAWPLWYRFRRTIKTSVVVCVMVWVILIVCLLNLYFLDVMILLNICIIYFLLAFPLFIFFLGGTLKALSASTVPSDEKRRIVGVLVLVLLIYTLLFMPRIISFLLQDIDSYTSEMEDFSINTSQNYSSDYSNITSNNEHFVFIMNVVEYIIISVGLPLTLVAIYALYSLFQQKCYKKEVRKVTMKFENILEEIDGFGPFQISLIILLCSPRIVLPCHFLLNNFIAALPPHRCDISALHDGGRLEI
ncbi:G-protein coupled receptor 4 [Nibea albiflora]|nr:G-protein coupled receptor 4 [Nibea albiflora]